MPTSLPPTSLTLLAALRQGLRWEEFVALYGLAVLRWCRLRRGISEADAEDVRQEILVKVWKYLGSYDPSRGRFRSWLFRCTCNALNDLKQSPPAQTTNEESQDFAHLAAPEVRFPLRGTWEDALRLLEEEGFAQDELQQAVLEVRDRVEPATWKAFLLSVFLDMSGQDIAARLGMTPTAVYQAICRVRRLLQQIISKERSE